MDTVYWPEKHLQLLLITGFVKDITVQTAAYCKVFYHMQGSNSLNAFLVFVQFDKIVFNLLHYSFLMQIIVFVSLFLLFSVTSSMPVSLSVETPFKVANL